MTIITPDSTGLLVSKQKMVRAAPDSKETAIPTDPEGIKKYLASYQNQLDIDF